MMDIVDRRSNPTGKNLPNRQRFMERAKEAVRDAVNKSIGDTKITDTDGKRIRVRNSGTDEPRLHHGKGGNRNYVIPGNKEYIKGDTIQRPSGGSGGRGNEGSPDGDGNDDFEFVVNREEYLDIFLGDLELPEQVKRYLLNSDVTSPVRAGYSVSGSPANLAVNRTVRNSISRRLAMRRPKPEEIEALRQAIEALSDGSDDEKLRELTEEFERKKRRLIGIPFVDPIDVRYRRFEQVPKPISSAVMFCLMDVSGSMTEHMKDLAKRFYVLLYIFLRRNYKNVDVVFIRYTHEAQEVDENTFFTDTSTGGTVVSKSLEVMRDVVAKRYPVDYWNIYAAMASDGDNTASDNDAVATLMEQAILPVCQYIAYVETGRDSGSEFPPGFVRRETDLWQTLKKLGKPEDKLSMRKIGHRSEIYPVFRELFAKRQKAASA